jgi:hypothetical protein
MTTPAASAAHELTDLVVKMRGWDHEEVRRAITTRLVQGWPFEHIALVLVRLAITDGTTPGHLTAPRPAKRRRKPQPLVLAAVQPATAELVALAVKMRGDWDEAGLRAALAVCHDEGGWPFAQAVLDTVRLAITVGSEPRDLAAMGRSPYTRRTLADRRG